MRHPPIRPNLTAPHNPKGRTNMSTSANALSTNTIQVDFCVVGGGLSGLCAALAAARRGVRTAIIHERPVFGGNASSEIRMWVCGAHGENMMETGIIEELRLANLHRNPSGNWSIWDSVLHEAAAREPNLLRFLNCSVFAADMDGDRIRAVTGWQMTTQRFCRVEAESFADCSGDSILAPLTGAKFRLGREAADEFNEDIAPPQADRRTMGMSCLIQARETSRPQPFIPPTWAHTYVRDDDLPFRGHNIQEPHNNFWWLELGGEQNSIDDTEEIRDELLKIAFGVWDHIKNQGDHGAENWQLDWLGFLPGKRESRRYEGEHILTQNDVRAEGKFDDIVAYGGWSMDDHHPAGFHHPGAPTIFHPAPSPYGIPYRCLYSKNIRNLWFAGRNISATHAAMSSTRVMATCSILGQAVGTAAALATQNHCSPREVGTPERMQQLQQALLQDDCFLPGIRMRMPTRTKNATLRASSGDPEPLRDGYNRPDKQSEHAWACTPGSWVEYAFDQPVPLKSIRIVFDSNLNRPHLFMPCSYPLDAPAFHLPPELIRDFQLSCRDGDEWQPLLTKRDNHQRLFQLPLARRTVTAIRLTILATWGAPASRVFAFNVA